MGSVEAALAKGDPERVVALKRLLPDAARDKRRVDMFLREAKLAAMLDHPNVVSAFDYGEVDGELYLAMEYVEGQPLSRVLKVLADGGEQLPITLVAYLLAEVCRGLHAAHELADPATGQPLNLVHRDVSPQNVMIGYDGRVRLLDFGVAKIETENVTKTGEVKGKSAYMSPEQAMGDPLDRRSDLFGVGAVLFECLALRRMWGDGTDMEVIRKLALEQPPSLEETKRTGLAPELVALHQKLVARAPADRPTTAADVASSLDALMPVSKDDAQAALRKLLDDHFADQAAEQRERLNASLHEVAPEQAAALRASVMPSRPPPSVRSKAPTPPVPAPPPATSGTARIARIAVPLAIVALIAWRLSASSTTTSTDLRPEPSTTLTKASASAPPQVVPSAPPSVAVSSAPPAASEKPPVITTNTTAPVRPPPSVIPAPKPVRSAKPLDVDDKPF